MAILVNNRRGERIIDYQGLMAPTQYGKDPECIIELSREKWDVPGTSGDSPLGLHNISLQNY